MSFASASVGSLTTGVKHKAIRLPGYIIGSTSPEQVSVTLSNCPCCNDLKTCTSGLTIAAWFKFTNGLGNGKSMNLFGGKMTLDIEVGCRLIASVGTSDGKYVTDPVTVPSNEWHLVVMSWVPSAGLRLFVDGCLISNVTAVNNPATVPPSAVTKISIMNILDDDYLFDDFCIWSRHKTNEFVMKYYNSHLCQNCVNMTALWLYSVVLDHITITWADWWYIRWFQNKPYCSVQIILLLSNIQVTTSWQKWEIPRIDAKLRPPKDIPHTLTIIYPVFTI